MRRRWSSPRIAIPLGALVLIGGFSLTEPQPQSAITLQRDVIWVYSTALCAKPGDTSDCKPIPVEQRPAFGSHQACSDHRDADLAREANPHLLGSCRKQHEA